jgi:hypothetical protein
MRKTPLLCAVFVALSVSVSTWSCRAQTLESSPLTIQVPDSDLPAPLVFIAYGDVRFTDPRETDATNPVVRRWIADRIAQERPSAVLLSGDIPWHGLMLDDYEVFQKETAAWSAAHIFISAALGNHEMNGLDKRECLENWWKVFPALRGHRWYSVELGSRIFILNLDSTSPLTRGSPQQQWIRDQLAHLPSSVKFIFFNVHHPPVADVLPDADAEHNPRPNEIALADLLRDSPAKKQARLIVNSGHIHNYERFLRDDIVYLVSGGGGAQPRLVRRSPDDLYENPAPVNYHYLKFVLNGDNLSAEMIRVADPAAPSPTWEVRDRFEVAGL